MTKKMKSLLSLVMSVVMLGSMVSCGNPSTPSNSSKPDDGGNSSSSAPADSSSEEDSSSTETPVAGRYTYKTFTTVSPSNWNELTYQDNNDTQIMNYLTSPLFEFDFKFDAEGEIIPGDFEVEYAFATGLKDLSEGEGLIWEIKIREDGKWHDGTPIVAGDFVYTMQEQLNPLFKHYRADSFYNGANVIKNAKNYVFQGSTVTSSARDKYATWEEAKVDETVYFDVFSNNTGVNSYLNAQYGADYYEYGGEGTGWAGMYVALFGYAGTVESIMALQGKNYAEISADETLNATWEAVLATWQTLPDEELDFFAYDEMMPEFDWANVGISAPDDTTIVLELEKPLHLLKDDGTLSYLAAYNMASLPLVKKDLYEACKQAPVEGSDLWTSTYHSSLETTASWGPYMLTEFQAGKMYKLEKNPNWFGWNMEKYEGQYETTHIECETIAEYNTAFMKFLKGEIAGIGITVAVADDYKNSERAYYTPSDYVGSLQLQSNKVALAGRESEGINKTILSYEEFRKALSLGIDRNAYAKTTTTAHLAGFGLFNSMHYYDVANGKAYRESDAAKKVLCNVYGVDPDDYASLDDAVDAITGYDLVQARELVDIAYDKAIEAGDLKETDKVVLTYGASTDNENVRRYYDTLRAQFIELMKGTKLEGKFDLDFDASFGTKWADDFRAGAYDICQGGWTGAAWDPGYFLLAYLGDDYRYASAWDPSVVTMEFTMKGVNADGEVTNNEADEYTATKTLANWYDVLNGDWAAGALNDDFRLELIAALEEQILLTYYTVPVTYEFGASMLSYQVDYITYEYNTFMSYGGIQYMTYNYDDAEWAAYVKANAQNGELNYK